MEDNGRPMFIIKDAKEIKLHKNTTTSETMAEIGGHEGTKFEATENAAGFGKVQSKEKTEKTSFWMKIYTAVVDNLIKIIIGVLGFIFLAFLKD